ncbi:MAG: S-layer family protein, partial [Burkholderiales bacterium]|nr:S-layer family protein [Burkholderiales bacterium]
MTARRPHHPAQAVRTALASAAVVLCGALPASQALAASCTWIPAAGNWNVAGNWTCAPTIPSGPAGDSATIGSGKVVTVNDGRSIFNLTNAGTINIDAATFTLQGGGTVNNAGGAINVANGVVLNQLGVPVTGGTLATTGSGRIVVSNSNANFFNGVALNGTLDLAGGTGIERVTGGLTLNGGINVNLNSVLSFNGSQTLGGTGTIVLGDTGGSNRALSMEGDTALTIGSNIVVRGQNGTVGQAYLAGGAQSLVNNGRISADVAGGSISLAPSNGVTNNGVLEAQNGGTLVLNSNVAGGVGGSIVAGTGSTVLQNGVALSGTINTSGTGNFRAANSNANFLNGVTLNGTLDLASGTGIERVTGGLTLNGGINVNLNSVLSFAGTQNLGGTGTIVLGDTGGSNRALSMEGDTALTIGSGVVVRGQNGTIGQAYLAGGAQSLVNNGRISADVAGGSISLAPSGGTTNNGILEAQNGGTLVLNSNVTGTVGSHIDVGTGSLILQNGVSLNGVINTAGGGSFRSANSNSNFLNGVSFNGTLDLASGTSIERVTGGLTLNGGVNVNLNSVLSFAGDQTLGGTGTIVLGNTGASNRALSMEGNTVLTVGSGIVVRGENGTVGQAYLAGGAQSLVNNGRISADVAGGSISLAPSNGALNNGILEAQNGGVLVLNSNVTGGATGSIVAGAGSTVLQNGVTLSGIINASGTGNFRAANSNSNFLNGVSFNGPLDLASGTSVERVVNGLTLNGTVNVNLNSVLSFQGTQAIGGTGTIVLGDTGVSNRALSMEGDTVLTVGPGVAVRGQNGTVGQAYIAGGTQVLVNNGSILADVLGGLVDLSAGTTNNASLLGAAGGGTLRLTGAINQSGAGRIDSADASAVIQNGITITGGLISSSGSGVFVPSNSNANFLSAVTLSGLLDMSGTGIERVVNGLTLAGGTVKVNANSVFAFNGDQALGGTGEIVLGNTGSSNRALSMGGDTTLTVGSGVLIHGINGTLGQVYAAGGAQTLINNGTINSDGGGLISVVPSTALVNNGTLRAQSGTLNIGQGLTGTGTLQVDSAGVMNLANLANAQGKLLMGTAGSALNLGTQNLTISNDYTNAAAGV